MNKNNLKIDWCGIDAARFAVMNWHYSRAMPSGKLAKFGVWEQNRFIGAVIFGRGATPEIGSPFGLTQIEVCELVRVALNKHQTPVTRILAIAMKILKRDMPGVRLVVSFADSSQGHHGGIYQGGGWIYLGSQEYHCYLVNGQRYHPRTLGARYGKGGQSIPWLRKNIDPKAERIKNGIKHKYVWPFDADLAKKLQSISKPYPKRVSSIDSDAPACQ